jgi:hypothetical protein
MAVGALVISLSATTLVGNAAASPSAEDTRGCSVLAQERNAGAHRLHEAWRGFNEQLRGLSRSARDLARDARRSGSELTVDAREDIAAARGELSAISTAAHAELQDKVELGTVCKEPVVTEAEDPHITLAALVDTDTVEDDDTVTVTVTLSVQFNEELMCGDEDADEAACKSLFKYLANGDDGTTAADAKSFELSDDGTMATLTFELDEDVEVDGTKDELAFTSGTLKDGDGHAMASETEATVELSIQTNDLVTKYRDVVDQAIQDMQAVMDPLNAAVAEMLAAAETAETADDASVMEKRGKAKADRETKGKPEGAGKPADAGSKGKGKGRG